MSDQPQVIYIREKRGTSCFTWLVAILLIPVLLVTCVSMLESGPSGQRDTGAAGANYPREKTPREQAKESLEIVEWTWGKKGFGNIMEATFRIRNKGPKDFKDIEIECVHTAPSGTVIDRNLRVIYEVVKAGETRTFKDFNMGFIHSQASKSAAGIRNAVPMP
jgi:hypothetical protein